MRRESLCYLCKRYVRATNDCKQCTGDGIAKTDKGSTKGKRARWMDKRNRSKSGLHFCSGDFR
jgi:hypothetical protein